MGEAVTARRISAGRDASSSLDYPQRYVVVGLERLIRAELALDDLDQTTARIRELISRASTHPLAFGWRQP